MCWYPPSSSNPRLPFHMAGAFLFSPLIPPSFSSVPVSPPFHMLPPSANPLPFGPVGPAHIWLVFAPAPTRVLSQGLGRARAVPGSRALTINLSSPFKAIVARANSLKNSGVPDDIFQLDDLSVLVCAPCSLRVPPCSPNPISAVQLKKQRDSNSISGEGKEILNQRAQSTQKRGSIV